MTGLVDEGRAADTVYLDLRKAFNTSSTVRVTEPWQTLSREVVESPFLETFQNHLATV